jgi:hypothetical protein
MNDQMPPESSNEETDNIISLTDIFEKEAQAQAKLEFEQLFEKAQQLSAQVQKLEEDNQHLRELLVATIPFMQNQQKVDRIVKPVHETICELQIELLLSKATQAELNLEEVKRLDLLVKNLYAAKKADPQDNSLDIQRIPLPLPKQDIRKLAERKVDEPDTES